MRRFGFLWCAIFLLLCTGWIVGPGASAESQGSGVLKVVIGGMKNQKGDVKVALFNSREGFEGNGTELRTARAGIKGGQSECEFDDVPFGVYAVKAYHDENGNGKLDKNALGQPRERYGFSNNARSAFGPPDYDVAKFSFDRADMVLKITLE